jgi:AcrR family transcriptional regulator
VAETEPVKQDARVQRTCRRVLAVAGQLLVDEGADAVTFDRVSRVAAVSRTTLYRHWARPVDLLIDAYRELSAPPPVARTGDLVADLLGMLRATRDGLRDGVWTRALPSLIAAAENDAALAAVHADFTDRRRQPMLERLRAAATTGEIAADADVAWLCDALISPLFYRRYQRHIDTTDAYLTSHVGRCLAAAASGPATRPSPQSSRTGVVTDETVAG